MRSKNLLKRTKLYILMIIVVSILSACGGTSFIDDGNGHKQYKDEKGNFVKNDWVEIKGKKYYFDLNGYLVTDQWIQDEYYVDNNGVMQVDYWYDDKNGSIYYLGNDGKYLRDTIKEIDGSLYAFDTFGKMLKNAPYVSSEEGYYFGNDAKADKTEGYKNFADTYCYVKDDGKLLINSWKEDDGKWYYFDENGLMQRNSFIDGIYYVDENGEMVKNKEIKIGNDIYVFDSEGKSKKKQIPTISFKALKNKYGNSLWKVSSDDSEMNIELGPLMTGDVNAGLLTGKFDWASVNGNTRVRDVTSTKILDDVSRMNNELKFPSNTISQIMQTSANDGKQKVSNNGVTLVWSVKTSGRNSLYLYLSYYR